MTTTSPESVGLRERKKVRLHEALLDSGLRLFHENGYGQTTTEEIAACAGVSQRTFFRYFASKEEIVLEALRGMDVLLFTFLRDRPADEPPFTALRNALRDSWAHMDQESLHLQGGAGKLLTESSELIDANMRYCHRRQHQLAEVIGERTGVDPATDPRPGLAAAVFFAAMNNGHQIWAESGSTSTDDLIRHFLAQLDLVPEIVGPSWGTPTTA